MKLVLSSVEFWVGKGETRQTERVKQAVERYLIARFSHTLKFPPLSTSTIRTCCQAAASADSSMLSSVLPNLLCHVKIRTTGNIEKCILLVLTAVTWQTSSVDCTAVLKHVARSSERAISNILRTALLNLSHLLPLDRSSPTPCSPRLPIRHPISKAESRILKTLFDCEILVSHFQARLLTHPSNVWESYSHALEKWCLLPSYLAGSSGFLIESKGENINNNRRFALNKGEARVARPRPRPSFEDWVMACHPPIRSDAEQCSERPTDWGIIMLLLTR